MGLFRRSKPLHERLANTGGLTDARRRRGVEAERCGGSYRFVEMRETALETHAGMSLTVARSSPASSRSLAGRAASASNRSRSRA